MNRKQCLNFVDNVDSLQAIQSLLKDTIASDSIGWKNNAKKLLNYIESGFNGDPAFSIFTKNGNKKLPFYAFSSLALADCEGKGDCVNWCYSLKSWRYPAAFFRQLQNSLLLRFKSQVVKNAFYAIPQNKTLRLYVDGDFYSVENLRFWLDLCKARQDLQVYGYSKSWKLFLQLNATGYKFPENYLTNASSGSKYEKTGIENAFLKLPVVRGSFKAVTVEKRFIASKAYQDKDKPLSKEYRKQVATLLRLREKKVFACAGNCGNCLPAGRHACGSKDFTGVSIGIGVH
tara:strand:- start:154 stop:1017 length:864 start_codon:yes stop_codon:yes gene_type:complete